MYYGLFNMIDVRLTDNGTYRCSLKQKQQVLGTVTYHLFVPGNECLFLFLHEQFY